MHQSFEYRIVNPAMHKNAIIKASQLLGQVCQSLALNLNQFRPSVVKASSNNITLDLCLPIIPEISYLVNFLQWRQISCLRVWRLSECGETIIPQSVGVLRK
jgi:hypothetical protein